MLARAAIAACRALIILCAFIFAGAWLALAYLKARKVSYTRRNWPMNEATKQMLLGLARHLLTIAGGALATHGIINASGVETFVSIGITLLGLGWSLWDKYGRDIVTAQLEVWKAKSKAQSEALKKNSVAEPSAATIADKIPDPAITAATVAKTVAAGCILILLVALGTPSAYAQSDPGARNTTARPLGPIGRAIEAKQDAATGLSGGLGDLVAKIDGMALDDLKYAKALADADGGPTTKLAAACWAAWIDRIEKRQAANATPPPDPHLITDVTKLLALHDSLQASSPFMVACSPLANAMKQNVTQLIGAVAGGAVGIGKLLPGLP